MARSFLDAAATAMSRHSLAQLKQASAHSRQCSTSWRWHSLAHISQSSAHRLQNLAAITLPRLISADACRQKSAQSRVNAMQRVNIAVLWSFKQADMQWSQAIAHSLHSSMHI